MTDMVPFIIFKDVEFYNYFTVFISRSDSTIACPEVWELYVWIKQFWLKTSFLASNERLVTYTKLLKIFYKYFSIFNTQVLDFGNLNSVPYLGTRTDSDRNSLSIFQYQTIYHQKIYTTILRLKTLCHQRTGTIVLAKDYCITFCF